MPPDQHPTTIMLCLAVIAVLPSLIKATGDAVAKIIAALKRGRK